MKRQYRFTKLSSLLLVALYAAPTFGQKLPDAGPQPRVAVTPAATATAQIAHGRALMERYFRASSDQERTSAFAEAWANLYVVRQIWPKDGDANVTSALLLADLSETWNLQKNVVEVLSAAAKDAQGTAHEPGLELRLGRAYDATGDAANAEQHLLAAEKSLHSAHSTIVESSAVLSALGSFYQRHGQTREAIKRFHAGRDLSGQDALHQAEFQLRSLKAAAELTDEPSHDTARGELDAVLRKITDARGKSARVEDNRTLNTLESDANRVKARLKL